MPSSGRPLLEVQGVGKGGWCWFIHTLKIVFLIDSGVILGYNVTLLDTDRVISSFNTTTESFVVDSLMCCSSYSYAVVARTSMGEGPASEEFDFMTPGEADSEWKY